MFDENNIGFCYPLLKVLKILLIKTIKFNSKIFLDPVSTVKQFNILHFQEQVGVDLGTF